MITEAIKKIKDEMEKNNNPYVKVVGEFLLKHLEMHPKEAEKIMSKDKTIGKSLEEMRKVAEKKKVGNCAVLTDQEGFEIVLKYFGIKDRIDKADITPEVKPVHAPTENIEEPKSKKDIDFDVSLKDFL